MQERTRPRENWFDPEYVRYWLDEQGGRTGERLRSFAMIRALIPRRVEEPFRVLDVGGGDGWLAETLLSRFEAAHLTVLDQSAVMLGRAAERLRPFGGRAATAQGDLRSSEWTTNLNPPYEVAVSTIAIHNLGDRARIRALYREVFQVVAEGGCFLNYDYLRTADPLIGQMARWAASDPDGGFNEERARGGARGGGGGRARMGTDPETRGTLEDQLAWLREAGFSPVEAFWKQFQTAVLAGFKGDARVPVEP